MYRTLIWFDNETIPIWADVIAIRNLGPKSIATIEYVYEDLSFMYAQQTLILDSHTIIGLN